MSTTTADLTASDPTTTEDPETTEDTKTIPGSKWHIEKIRNCALDFKPINYIR